MTAKNIGEVRKMTDRRLVNALLNDRSSTAVYTTVIRERMGKDRYGDFYFWVQDGEDYRPKTEPQHQKKPDPLRDFVVTKYGELLDAELADLAKRYPFFGDSYDPLDDPARCYEFCCDKGRRSKDNIYGKTEDDLTDKQLRMLKAIRSHSYSWLIRERKHVGWRSK